MGGCCTSREFDASTEPLPPSSCCHPVEASRLTVVGDGDPSRGVSVEFLNGGLLELLNVNTDSPEAVYHVEPVIRKLSAPPLICPRDGRPGCAFVDVAPDSFAGRANLMISYAWHYRVYDIVSALALHCLQKCLDPKAAIIWICFICINQHRVKEAQANGVVVPFDEFEATFKERVVSIGKMVCLLAPWHEPYYVKRVWCVFELYTATTRPDVQVDLILPPCQLRSFEAALGKNGLEQIWDVLDSLKVENAQASVEEDRRAILKLVEAGPGTEYVNKRVQGNLRTEFAELAIRSLELQMDDFDCEANQDQAKDLASSASAACRFWILQGASLSEGLCFAEKVESFVISHVGCGSHDRAAASGLVAWAAMLSSKFDKAILAYESCLKFYEEDSGKLTKQYGQIMADLGWAWCSKGFFDKAVEILHEAQSIQAKVLGKLDPAYGITLRDMAEAMVELKLFDSAFQAFEEAIPILEAAFGRRNPHNCIALKHQSRVLIAQGDVKKAIDILDEVLEIEQATVGPESPDHAITLIILSDALRVLGRLGRALYICDCCLLIFERTYGIMTKFYLWALWTHAQILQDMDDDRAEGAYEDALEIAEHLAGKDSTRYVRIKGDLDKLRSQSDFAFKSVRTDTDPWGDGAEETALLAKFKELDSNHTGLIAFAEVMRMVRKLLARDLEEFEIEGLAQACRIGQDYIRKRRLSFRQFQELGRIPKVPDEQSIVHLHQIINEYFQQLVLEYEGPKPRRRLTSESSDRSCLPAP